MTHEELKAAIIEELGRALENIPIDSLCNDSFNAAEILIDHMPILLTAIGEEIEADGWISVDARMPDEGKMYLITNGVDCDTCLFVETRAGFTTSFIGKATHWKPLPEPPAK